MRCSRASSSHISAARLSMATALACAVTHALLGSIERQEGRQLPTAGKHAHCWLGVGCLPAEMQSCMITVSSMGQGCKGGPECPPVTPAVWLRA